MSSEVEAVPRRVNPQNQENDFVRQNPRAYSVPGAETPEVDGVPERRVSPSGFDGTEGSEHPNSVNEASLYRAPEVPRGRGATTQVREPSDITGALSELPPGSSASIPTTPNTPYYYEKAPTGQTLYFYGPNALANATAYANSLSQAKPPTVGPVSIPGRFGSTYVHGGTNEIAEAAGGLYSGFTTGAEDLIIGSGALGRVVGSGGRESFSQAYQNFQTQQLPIGITGKQYAQAGASAITYVVPGVPIIKGISEGNSPQAAFDIGVGAIGILPLVAPGASAIKALSILNSPLAKFGLGAGLSATGTAASGNYNPVAIGESAVLGGTASLILGSIANRVLTGPGPIKGAEVAPPVAGGEAETTVITPRLIGVKVETIQGKPPVDISDLVQQFEGPLPAKGGTTGPSIAGEIQPPLPPSVSYMSEHITDIPYANLFDISQDIRLGQGASNLPYEPVSSPVKISGYSVGAGGTRDLPPAYSGGGGQTFIERTGPVPPGTVSPADAFLDNLKLKNFQTFTDITPESSVGSIATPLAVFPSIGLANTSALGISSGITQFPSVSLNTDQNQIPGTSITPSTAITPVTTQTPCQAITPVAIPGQSNPFPIFPSQRPPPPPFFAPIAITSFGSGREGPRSRKAYVFGEKLSAVRTVFLGADFEFQSAKKHTRTKKRRKK